MKIVIIVRDGLYFERDKNEIKEQLKNFLGPDDKTIFIRGEETHLYAIVG